MTLAENDAAPQTRGEPLYLRRPLRYRRCARDDRQSRHQPGVADRLSMTGVPKSDLPAEARDTPSAARCIG